MRLAFNQVIKFEEYYTSKVKGGWTSSYETKFITRFRKAKTKSRVLSIFTI